MLVGVFFALTWLIVWNYVGFWLDEILFSRWKDEEIVAPLFIVGNARSGTTFFHRLVDNRHDRHLAIYLLDNLPCLDV